MRIAPSPAKLLSYLKAREKKSLLAGCLVFFAGAILSSIGILKLFASMDTWMLSGTLWGRQFDKMMTESIVALLVILPCFVFFVIAYLLAESHSLGVKLSLSMCVGLLVVGVIVTKNAQLTLAGVLCGWAAEIESEFPINLLQLFDRKKIKKEKNRDSPTTTEKIAKLGLRISGATGIILLLGMVIYISARGIKYVNWDFISGTDWTMGKVGPFAAGSLNASMGISDSIIGSFLVVGLAEAIALPIGLGAAIYMAEYAPENRITSTIRFFIETLAGAPSIVIALLGVYYFVNQLKMGTSWLPASLCLSFMTLPWNIRVAEEAMKAVPYSYREGSYALGATKWQTIRRVIFMSASPGIITGIVLGLGTAFGESTVLMWTADTGGGFSLPAGLPLTGNGMPTLPTLIFRIWKWQGHTSGVADSWDVLNVAFAAAFVLLIVFFAISGVALIARNYLSKKNSGK